MIDQSTANQTVAPEPELWTTQGFLAELQRTHDWMNDRQFAFVLGAGASRSSQIPTGSELVETWLNELHEQLDFEGLGVAEWATPERLDIANFSFDKASAFYPEIFERRFRNDPEMGFATLEALIDGKEPGVGYTVLATILATQRHNVVITTNFDDLVADAVYLHATQHPLVCGHESLTQFVRPRMRRPLVAKIHRHLFYEPLNDPIGTGQLPSTWKEALKTLLQHYTPIVIGYGGNDGSLMNFLQDLPPRSINGGMFWCYRSQDGMPDSRVQEMLLQQGGVMVPILGFDEILVQIGSTFGIPLLDTSADERAQERTRYLRSAFEQLIDRLSALQQSAALQQSTSDTEAVEAVRRVVSEAIDPREGWWAWEVRARSAPNDDEREQIYREGLQSYPRSADLAGNFARFLDRIGSVDEAERMFRMAVNLNPEHAHNLGDFAQFLYGRRQALREAETYFVRARELDPGNLANRDNFAAFLREARGDTQGAEELYLTIGAPRRSRTPGLAEATSEAKRLIEEEVEKSQFPIVSAVIADLLLRELGTTLGDNWAGTGGFKEFVSRMDEPAFKVSWAMPGYFYDPKRHEIPSADHLRTMPTIHEDDEVNNLASQIKAYYDIPLWTGPAYRSVFSFVSDYLKQNSFNMTSLTRAIRDYFKGDSSIQVSRQAANFVVQGIRFGGLNLAFNPNPSTDELIDAYRRNLEAICASLGLRPGDRISRWLRAGDPEVDEK